MRPTNDSPPRSDGPPLHLDLGDVPGGALPMPGAVGVKRKSEPAAFFEIGGVYRKASRCYLAVSGRTLITFKGGDVQEIRPSSRYDAVRTLSVEELCVKWGITLQRLDDVVLRYLAPSPAGVKPRPCGTRRQRATDDLVWRSMRTVRLAG